MRVCVCLCFCLRLPLCFHCHVGVCVSCLSALWIETFPEGTDGGSHANKEINDLCLGGGGRASAGSKGGAERSHSQSIPAQTWALSTKMGRHLYVPYALRLQQWHGVSKTKRMQYKSRKEKACSTFKCLPSLLSSHCPHCIGAPKAERWDLAITTPCAVDLQGLLGMGGSRAGRGLRWWGIKHKKSASIWQIVYSVEGIYYLTWFSINSAR